MSGTNSHQTASSSGHGSGHGAGADSAHTANTSSKTPTSSSTYQPPTKYRFVKDNWGNRLNFQYSHGLKLDPDDFEEGNLILDGYLECHRAEHEHRESQGKKVNTVHILSASCCVFLTGTPSEE